MHPIHSMPGHLIRRLHQISVSLFSENTKAEGINLTSPQFAALAVLQENPGIDQATLAGMIALDRPTIGGVIERLVSKGLVVRRTSERDRRAKRLEVTRQGKTLLAQMRPVVELTQSQILEGLTEAEQVQFIALADKITRLHNDRSRAPLILRETASS